MAAALALNDDDEIFIPLTRGNLMFFLVEIANMVWTCVFDSSDLIRRNQLINGFMLICTTTPAGVFTISI